MKSIAITGSFASGKTFVLKYLEKVGYKTFSCDEYVKQLYLDQNIQQELLCIFDKKLFIFKHYISILKVFIIKNY